jgi:hypothetical protein
LRGNHDVASDEAIEVQVAAEEILSPAGKMIRDRMRWIDRGQGCHAALDTIRRAVDPKERTYSISQARRLVAGLRRKGEIHFLAVTHNNCNIYLFPGKQYDVAKVPICASRPVYHLWPTDEAERLLKEKPPRKEPLLVDGYPVAQRIAADYKPDLVKEAVGIINKSYAGRMNEIHNRTALLKSICQKLLDKRDTAAEETATARWWMRSTATWTMRCCGGRWTSFRPAAFPPIAQPSCRPARTLLFHPAPPFR